MGLTTECLITGKNFKDHYVGSKKHLIESFLDKKYPKYKEDKGQNFLQDLSELINNDTVQYVGKGTLKKDQDLVNIYRGNGITLVTKDPNEYVTVLKSGEGMDLGINIVELDS